MTPPVIPTKPCVLCGTTNRDPASPAWEEIDPFCWVCGSYLRGEGNYFKLTADEAIEFATAAASCSSLRTDHPDHFLFELAYDCRRRWTDRLEAYP